MLFDIDLRVLGGGRREEGGPLPGRRLLGGTFIGRAVMHHPSDIASDRWCNFAYFCTRQ